jgi:hypothetical protein
MSSGEIGIGLFGSKDSFKIFYVIFLCLQKAGLDDGNLLNLLRDKRFPENIGIKSGDCPGLLMKIVNEIREKSDFTAKPRASLALSSAGLFAIKDGSAASAQEGEQSTAEAEKILLSKLKDKMVDTCKGKSAGVSEIILDDSENAVIIIINAGNEGSCNPVAKSDKYIVQLQGDNFIVESKADGVEVTDADSKSTILKEFASLICKNISEEPMPKLC